MSRVLVSAIGSFSPDRFREALLDFSSNRSSLWAGSSPGLFSVHDQGDTWAEVTEGTSAGGIWQRYRYDWSDPSSVRLTVLDSNAFGLGSFWLYRLSPIDHGRTKIDLEITRIPTTLKGRLLDPLLRLTGRFYFGRDLRRTIRRIEIADERPAAG